MCARVGTIINHDGCDSRAGGSTSVLFFVYAVILGCVSYYYELR